MPPLRERREDIPLLVDHFVRKFSREMNKKITRVSPAAMNVLQQYNWPGNVRELENAVERAMVVAQEPELREQDFTLKSTQRRGLGIGDVRSLDDVENATTSCGCWTSAAAIRRAPPRCSASIASPCTTS